MSALEDLPTLNKLSEQVMEHLEIFISSIEELIELEQDRRNPDYLGIARLENVRRTLVGALGGAASAELRRLTRQPVKK